MPISIGIKSVGRRPADYAVIMLSLLLVSCSSDPQKRRDNDISEAPSNGDIMDKYIGTAEMLDDRSIVLNLSLDEPGMIGDASKIYRADDPNYEEVRRHVGPIEPGQTVRVKPFPAKLR